MKPCRKLLDVMYEQRATIRARINELSMDPPPNEDSDFLRARLIENRRALESIDHIIDAYCDALS